MSANFNVKAHIFVQNSKLFDINIKLVKFEMTNEHKNTKNSVYITASTQKF